MIDLSDGAPASPRPAGFADLLAVEIAAWVHGPRKRRAAWVSTPARHRLQACLDPAREPRAAGSRGAPSAHETVRPAHGGDCARPIPGYLACEFTGAHASTPIWCAQINDAIATRRETSASRHRGNAAPGPPCTRIRSATR